MRRSKKFAAWLLAAALFVLPLSGCGNSETGSQEPEKPATTDNENKPEQTAPEFVMEDYTLRYAENTEEIGQLLSSVLNGDSYSSAENVGIVDEFFSDASRPTYAGNYGESSSRTQVLPDGVLEASSAVLADGYLYRVQDSDLTILQAAGDQTKTVSTTPVCGTGEGYDNYEETAQAVVVEGNFAAVMTYVYAWSMQESDSGEWTTKTVSQTHVRIFDVSDKAAPEQVLDYVQDGSYCSAYLAGGKLYLTTDYYVMEANPEDPASFMPSCGTAGEPQQLAAEQVLLNEQTDTAQFAVVSALSLADASVVDTIAVTGWFRPYFAEADSMLLCGWCYAMQQSEPYEENQYQVTDYYSHAITLVAQVSLADGLKMEKTACINGRLSDMDQMDLQDGYLRLATLEESYTNRLFQDDAMGFENLEMGEHTFSNEVHVLDSEFKEVGRLTDLSDSCLMYYQRFVGDTGYFIAYNAENPVYLVNLTDPTNPVVGDSIYTDKLAEMLFRFGDQSLGLTAEGQLQLLNLSAGTMEKTAEAETGDVYLTTRYHLDSVLVDAASGLVVLPGNGTVELYRVADNAITSVGSVELAVSEKSRTLMADGFVYITTDAGVTVLNAENGETAAQVNIAVG